MRLLKRKGTGSSETLLLIELIEFTTKRPQSWIPSSLHDPCESPPSSRIKLISYKIDCRPHYRS